MSGVQVHPDVAIDGSTGPLPAEEYSDVLVVCVREDFRVGAFAFPKAAPEASEGSESIRRGQHHESAGEKIPALAV